MQHYDILYCLVINTPVATIEATASRPRKTAEITADTIGTSRAKVERARAVLSDPDESAAVRRGEKTIHQAAEAVKAKRAAPPSATRKKALPSATQQANDNAVAEGLRIIGLLHELVQRNPNAARRKVVGVSSRH